MKLEIEITPKGYKANLLEITKVIEMKDKNTIKRKNFGKRFLKSNPALSSGSTLKIDEAIIDDWNTIIPEIMPAIKR